MNDLYAFLNPASPEEERDVIISDRFKNEDGTTAKFRIRALKQEENDALINKCRKNHKVNGQWQQYLDTTELGRRTVLMATVYPDFSNAELCKAYGVMDPLLVPGRMLKAGEYAKLLQEINNISGFDNEIDSIEEQAKN